MTLGHPWQARRAEPPLPAQFTRVVELGLVRLEPWVVLGDACDRRELARYLERRFPAAGLVPFARRRGSGLVAAWHGGPDLGPVVVFDPTAVDGWDARTELADFHAWLRGAVEDLILDFW